MVYLLGKKEQLRLETAHLFTPFPAFHQQLLVIFRCRRHRAVNRVSGPAGWKRR